MKTGGAVMSLLVMLAITSSVTSVYHLQSPDDVSRLAPYDVDDRFHVMSQSRHDDGVNAVMTRRAPGWGKRHGDVMEALMSHLMTSVNSHLMTSTIASTSHHSRDMTTASMTWWHGEHQAGVSVMTSWKLCLGTPRRSVVAGENAILAGHVPTGGLFCRSSK